MSARLPTGLKVGALRRLVEEAGGSAMVLARGDEQGGTVLVLVLAADGMMRLVERGFDAVGEPALVESQLTCEDAESYWRRRRSRDPDLWVIELNVPQAERFIAETLLHG